MDQFPVRRIGDVTIQRVISKDDSTSINDPTQNSGAPLPSNISVVDPSSYSTSTNAERNADHVPDLTESQEDEEYLSDDRDFAGLDDDDYNGDDDDEDDFEEDEISLQSECGIGKEKENLDVGEKSSLYKTDTEKVMKNSSADKPDDTSVSQYSQVNKAIEIEYNTSKCSLEIKDESDTTVLDRRRDMKHKYSIEDVKNSLDKDSFYENNYSDNLENVDDFSAERNVDMDDLVSSNNFNDNLELQSNLRNITHSEILNEPANEMFNDCDDNFYKTDESNLLPPKNESQELDDLEEHIEDETLKEKDELPNDYQMEQDEDYEKVMENDPVEMDSEDYKHGLVDMDGYPTEFPDDTLHDLNDDQEDLYSKDLEDTQSENVEIKQEIMDEEFEDNEEVNSIKEGELDQKNKKRKKKRRTKETENETEDTDNDDEESEDASEKKKSKKSDNKSSASDSDDKDKSAAELKIGTMRRNIREVMDETKLEEATLAAQRQEMERLRRVQEQQKIIRDVQRQIVANRQNSKVQARVMSLLQGGSTCIVKKEPDAEPTAVEEKKPNTVVVKLSSGTGPPQIVNKKMLDMLKNQKNKIEDEDDSSNDSRLANLSKNLNKPQMMTASVSIAPIKPGQKKDGDSSDTSTQSSTSKKSEKPKGKDVVMISSSSGEDDCIVISEEEEESEVEEDTSNSGMHTNDLYNIPDEQGRVLINVGHPDSEPDVFLSPQIARVIKPHQIGGVRFLFDNIVESIERYKTSDGFGCILAHSMGLGKTLQVISFCDVFLRYTEGRTVLCIMPINTLQNWVAEFNMWLPMDPDTCALKEQGEVNPRKFPLFVLNDIQKSLSARANVILNWHKEGGVLLIGYELYRQLSLKKPPKTRKGSKRKTEQEEDLEDEKNKNLLEETYEALVKPGPDLVICDEGHRIKNSHASISQALKQIRSKRRVVLTGYPLQNNLLEYWCMVDFVRPNYLGTKTEFSNMFERPIQNGQCIDSTPQDIRLMRYRAHVLHSLLEGFVQRRSHSVLQQTLPRKYEFVLLLRLTTFQRTLYNTFMNEVVRTKAVPNPLKAFAVCCKIWNHPDILYNFLKKRADDEELDLDLEETSTSIGTPASGPSTPMMPSTPPQHPPLKRSRSSRTMKASQSKDLKSPRKNSKVGLQPNKTPAVATVMPNTVNAVKPEPSPEQSSNQVPPFNEYSNQYNANNQYPNDGYPTFNNQTDETQNYANQYPLDYNNQSTSNRSFNNDSYFQQQQNYQSSDNYYNSNYSQNNYWQGNSSDANYYQNNSNGASSGNTFYQGSVPAGNEQYSQNYSATNTYRQNTYDSNYNFGQNSSSNNTTMSYSDNNFGIKKEDNRSLDSGISESLLGSTQTMSSNSNNVNFPDLASANNMNYKMPENQRNMPNKRNELGSNISNYSGQSTSNMRTVSSSNMEMINLDNSSIMSTAGMSMNMMGQTRRSTSSSNTQNENASTSTLNRNTLQNQSSISLSDNRAGNQNIGNQMNAPSTRQLTHGLVPGVNQGNQQFGSNPSVFGNSDSLNQDIISPNVVNRFHQQGNFQRVSSRQTFGGQNAPGKFTPGLPGGTKNYENLTKSSSTLTASPTPKKRNPFNLGVAGIKSTNAIKGKFSPGLPGGGQNYPDITNTTGQGSVNPPNNQMMNTQNQSVVNNDQNNQMILDNVYSNNQQLLNPALSTGFLDPIRGDGMWGQVPDSANFLNRVPDSNYGIYSQNNNLLGDQLNQSFLRDLQTSNSSNLLTGGNAFGDISSDYSHSSATTDPNLFNLDSFGPSYIANLQTATGSTYDNQSLGQTSFMGLLVGNESVGLSSSIGNGTAKDNQNFSSLTQNNLGMGYASSPVGIESNYNTVTVVPFMQDTVTDNLRGMNPSSSAHNQSIQNSSMIPPVHGQANITEQVAFNKMAQSTSLEGNATQRASSLTHQTSTEPVKKSIAQPADVNQDHTVDDSCNQSLQTPCNPLADGINARTNRLPSMDFFHSNQNFIPSSSSSSSSVSSASSAQRPQDAHNFPTTYNYRNEDMSNILNSSTEKNWNAIGTQNIVGYKDQSNFNQSMQMERVKDKLYPEMRLVGQGKNETNDVKIDVSKNNSPNFSDSNYSKRDISSNNKLSTTMDRESYKDFKPPLPENEYINFPTATQTGLKSSIQNMQEEYRITSGLSQSTAATIQKQNMYGIKKDQDMSRNRFTAKSVQSQPDIGSTSKLEFPKMQLNETNILSSEFSNLQSSGTVKQKFQKNTTSLVCPIMTSASALSTVSSMTTPSSMSSSSLKASTQTTMSQTMQLKEKMFTSNLDNKFGCDESKKIQPTSLLGKDGKKVNTVLNIGNMRNELKMESYGDCKSDQMKPPLKSDFGAQVSDGSKSDIGVDIKNAALDDELEEGEIKMPFGPDMNVPTQTRVKEEPGIPYDWTIELFKDYEPGHIEASAKMLVFFCMLEETILLGDRLLLFSQSLFTLDLIEDFLHLHNIPNTDEKWMRNKNYFRLDGSTSALDREKLINEFNSNPCVHLFLVSTRAGSLGINLVGANRVVVFDASWNPCHDTQAVCRVYRYGQRKSCYVYRFVMDNCLEKKIYDRQINKQGMSDRVVDECNPDAHLTIKDVTNLCWDTDVDTEDKDFSEMKDKYNDLVIQKVIEKYTSCLSKEPFQHESLLIDRKDKKLSQAEKRMAKRSYELEKQANARNVYGFYGGGNNPHGLQMRAGKPTASVRPMQAENQYSRDGVRKWIPAEVWQKQGMNAQEMTLPLDVVIPTNTGDSRSSIVLRAGQKVMVLKSPKGIYMQLENGKIIAIKTAMKTGPLANKGMTRPIMNQNNMRMFSRPPTDKNIAALGNRRDITLAPVRNRFNPRGNSSVSITGIRPGIARGPRPNHPLVRTFPFPRTQNRMTRAVSTSTQSLPPTKQIFGPNSPVTITLANKKKSETITKTINPTSPQIGHSSKIDKAGSSASISKSTSSVGSQSDSVDNISGDKQIELDENIMDKRNVQQEENASKEMAHKNTVGQVATSEVDGKNYGKESESDNLKLVSVNRADDVSQNKTNILDITRPSGSKLSQILPDSLKNKKDINLTAIKPLSLVGTQASGSIQSGKVSSKEHGNENATNKQAIHSIAESLKGRKDINLTTLNSQTSAGMISPKPAQFADPAGNFIQQPNQYSVNDNSKSPASYIESCVPFSQQHQQNIAMADNSKLKSPAFGDRSTNLSQQQQQQLKIQSQQQQFQQQQSPHQQQVQSQSQQQLQPQQQLPMQSQQQQQPLSIQSQQQLPPQQHQQSQSFPLQMSQQHQLSQHHSSHQPQHSQLSLQSPQLPAAQHQSLVKPQQKQPQIQSQQQLQLQSPQQQHVQHKQQLQQKENSKSKKDSKRKTSASCNVTKPEVVRPMPMLPESLRSKKEINLTSINKSATPSIDDGASALKSASHSVSIFPVNKMPSASLSPATSKTPPFSLSNYSNQQSPLYSNPTESSSFYPPFSSQQQSSSYGNYYQDNKSIGGEVPSYISPYDIYKQSALNAPPYTSSVTANFSSPTQPIVSSFSADQYIGQNYTPAQTYKPFPSDSQFPPTSSLYASQLHSTQQPSVSPYGSYSHQYGSFYPHYSIPGVQSGMMKPSDPSSQSSVEPPPPPQPPPQ